jgi:hypothetical protein
MIEKDISDEYMDILVVAGVFITLPAAFGVLASASLIIPGLVSV